LFSSVQFENRDETNCGSGDIDGIVKHYFKATGNAKLNGAHPGGIYTGPTNTGDRVWSNGAKLFEVSMDGQYMTSSPHVKDE